MTCIVNTIKILIVLLNAIHRDLRSPDDILIKIQASAGERGFSF